MKNLWIYSLLFISPLFAQPPGAIAPGDTGKIYRKVMIVPFEPQMYLCGIQSELGAASGMNHQQIVQSFRYGLATELQNKFLYYYNTVSLVHFNDTAQDVLRTYGSLIYKFEPYEITPVEEEKEGRFSKKKAGKKDSKIEGGQVVSNKSTEPKFAALYFRQPDILKYLGNKYGPDLFVFITEMDIENDLSDQIALANNRYFRILRIHYAIVDQEGNFLHKGVAETRFPNSVKTVQEIKKNQFPLIAEQIAKKLPGTPQETPLEINPLEKILPGNKPE